jgi:glycosyltransferase involved in cell wall biosynthesis
MKVLVISASFPPMKSGGADYALRLSQELAQCDLQIRVLTSSIRNVATDPLIKVHPIMRQWSWRELPRLLRVVRRYRPDVINLHFVGEVYHHHPMITFLPALLKKLIPRIGIVTHLESGTGIDMSGNPLGARILWRILATAFRVSKKDAEFGTVLRDSDQVIVLSDEHRIKLKPFCANLDEKCTLIPPPPLLPMASDTTESRQLGREALGISSETFLLAYYGYIYPNKGIETLLKAFAIVRQSHPKVHLALIGGTNEVLLRTLNRPDYLQELQQEAQYLGIANDVIWTGYYPSESNQASLFLRGADLCVLPFDRGVYLNNSSFSAAAAHGLPIVTARPNLLETPFEDGKNLVFFPPQMPQALAETVTKLLDDAEQRRQLSKGALKLSREWLSWDVVIRRTLQCFHTATAAK